MGKGGKVNRSEPANIRFFYHRAKPQFQAVGWYRFLKKFLGENVVVSHEFAKKFDGEKVKLRRKTFRITETIIARAT